MVKANRRNLVVCIPLLLRTFPSFRFRKTSYLLDSQLQLWKYFLFMHCWLKLVKLPLAAILTLCSPFSLQNSLRPNFQCGHSPHSEEIPSRTTNFYCDGWDNWQMHNDCRWLRAPSPSLRIELHKDYHVGYEGMQNLKAEKKIFSFFLSLRSFKRFTQDTSSKYRYEKRSVERIKATHVELQWSLPEEIHEFLHFLSHFRRISSCFPHPLSLPNAKITSIV